MVYQTEGNGVRPALILSVLSFLPSREKQERGIKSEREEENGDTDVQMGKRLKKGGDRGTEKVKVSTLFSQPRPANDTQLCSISLTDPRLWSLASASIVCTCVYSLP